jgi:DNA primase
MGTQSWGQKKLRFLEFSGAARIILMFDGDAAGRIATRLVKTGLNKDKEKVSEPLTSIFDVKVVRLWEAEVPESFKDSKYDPGNCPTEILNKVKKLVI